MEQCPHECSNTIDFDVQTSNLDNPNEATYNQLINNPNGIDYYEYWYNVNLSTLTGLLMIYKY